MPAAIERLLQALLSRGNPEHCESQYGGTRRWKPISKLSRRRERGEMAATENGFPAGEPGSPNNGGSAGHFREWCPVGVVAAREDVLPFGVKSHRNANLELRRGNRTDKCVARP